MTAVEKHFPHTAGSARSAMKALMEVARGGLLREARPRSTDHIAGAFGDLRDLHTDMSPRLQLGPSLRPSWTSFVRRWKPKRR